MSTVEPELLRVEHLRFGWPGGQTLIDIESLIMQPALTAFLAGASGSGKSTLLSLLGGVLRPQAGSINLLGQDAAELGGIARDRFRADHIGIIFQQFNLLPYLSLVENVLLPIRFSKARRLRLTKRNVDPRDEAMRLLERLELDRKALTHQSVGELSIGQQQRVAAARALIGGPELILADEPTSALDEPTRERFITLLFEECERTKAGLLFVSHDRRLAPLFDKQFDLAQLNKANSLDSAS